MAMVYFMAVDNETVICLDSETGITVSQQNTTSQSSIMSGASASDGFIEGNKQISVEGVVTYSKSERQSSGGNPNPKEFRTLVEEIITSKTRFLLKSNTTGYDLIPYISNCVIKGYSYTVDKYLDTITVSLNIEQQFVTDAATVSYITPEVATGQEGLSAKDEATGDDNKTSISEDKGATIYQSATESGLDWLSNIGSD